MKNRAIILPIRTRIITSDDDMRDIVVEAVSGKLEDGDIVVIAESVLAITQGRAILIDDIKVGALARFLVRFVYKTPTGVGIGSPKSMQACLDEVGRWRVLFAAVIGGIGKIFGVRGWFYRVAGMQAALIDAKGGTMAPYDNHIVLGPRKPGNFAEMLSAELGVGVAVTDVNDLKCAWVIGASRGVDKAWLEGVLVDNPLGQTDEQTPVGIVR